MVMVIRVYPCAIGHLHLVEVGKGVKGEENTDLVVRVCICVIGRVHLVAVRKGVKEKENTVRGPVPRFSAVFTLSNWERGQEQ